jgi:hypothetical protein
MIACRVFLRFAIADLPLQGAFRLLIERFDQQNSKRRFPSNMVLRQCAWRRQLYAFNSSKPVPLVQIA